MGYPAAGLGILIEGAGIPFPGETALILVAAAASTGRLDIRWVILAGFAGSIVGADIGYLAGRLGGRRLLVALAARVPRGDHHLVRTERFFDRYGSGTVLFMRFLVGLRTFGALIAGAARMPFLRFQLFSAIGSVAWAVPVGLLGYELGGNLPLLHRVLAWISWGGLGAALLAAGGLAAWWYRRRRAAPVAAPPESPEG